MKVRVADATLILFLKMVSYLEHPADRLRDLGDIAHLLDASADDARLFSPDLLEQQIREDEAGAYLAGSDLGVWLDKNERNLALRFSSLVLDYREDGGFAQTKLTGWGPASWRDDPDRVLKLMRAFRNGLLKASGS